MTNNKNHLGQPIGFPLAGWTPPPRPPREPMEGRWCRLEPLEPDRHADALFSALATDTEGRCWTYMTYGPFDSPASYQAGMATYWQDDNSLFFVISQNPNETPVGVAAYHRAAPTTGSIECGHLMYSPRLQRSIAATEAMYLMMKQAFELGYRRYEWKCDALNSASRAAAQRLGFSFEGIFRQALVTKGRNRDTAWYAAIDSEWKDLEGAFLTWLDPGNFDGAGRQRKRLSDLTRPILKHVG